MDRLTAPRGPGDTGHLADTAHDGVRRKTRTTMATTKAKKAATKTRPVIVTTAHRGVFFGHADDIDGETISLKQARLCVYWSPAMRGFMGLASQGPDSGCRIGPPADITLRNITAVVEVSDAAVKRWEAAPWG